MVDFADPYSSLASGITQGANLALTIDQAKRQNSNREKELALKAADSKLELAKTFKKDSTRMMSLISSAAEDYRKAGVNVPELNGASFASEDSSKELSDALSMWSKNVSSGAWDADFGRKWLIQKGAEIGAKGDEFNAITEHAYKEALKPPREVGSESPSDIKGRLMGKYITGGIESLNPQERSVLEPELQDPALRQAQSVYLADPRNIVKPMDQKVKEIQDIANTLKTSSSTASSPTPEKPRKQELFEVVSQQFGKQIGDSFTEDWAKALRFLDDGVSIEEVVAGLEKKYASQPRLVNAIKKSAANELRKYNEIEEGDTDDMSPAEIKQARAARIRSGRK